MSVPSLPTEARSGNFTLLSIAGSVTLLLGAVAVVHFTVERDHVTSLDVGRALPTVPHPQLVTEAWPRRSEIMRSMTNRMRDDLISLGRPSIRAPQQLVVEDRVRREVEQLASSLTREDLRAPELAEFREALDEVKDLIMNRDEARSMAALDTTRLRILAENERLLKLAEDLIHRGSLFPSHASPPKEGTIPPK